MHHPQIPPRIAEFNYATRVRSPAHFVTNSDPSICGIVGAMDEFLPDAFVDSDEEATRSIDIDFSEVSFDGHRPEFRDVRARPLAESDPKQLGDFKLLTSFNSGPSARVFLGYRASSHGMIRPALLKWVPKTSLTFNDFRHALIDEARAMSSLAHPNLVSILDTGEDENGAFIALEYISGTDLSRILQALKLQERRCPINMACYVAVCVLRGLHHAHTASSPLGEPLEIVHRDVNPPNILVGNSGHIKLGDFGIARMQRRLQDVTQPGFVKGKFSYLAPEYITDGTCTPRGDVYATAVTLFEMITGRRCFAGKKNPALLREIVNNGVPIDDLRALEVPNALIEVVKRGTARSPGDRFASASEMASALELWLIRDGSYVGPSLFRNFLAGRPYSVDGLANELTFLDDPDSR